MQVYAEAGTRSFTRLGSLVCLLGMSGDSEALWRPKKKRKKSQSPTSDGNKHGNVLPNIQKTERKKVALAGEAWKTARSEP